MFKVPKNCTGCYACVNICPMECIDMEEREGGFQYPKINKSLCISCGQCENVCPVLHAPEIGTCFKALAIKNKNDEIRYQSSSGGFFSVLAEWVMNKGGIVFGAEYTEKFQVRHVSITNKDQLYKLQGAKYTQSVLGSCLKKVKCELLTGRLVLFSGTPCQCAALQSFLGKKYKNLIMADLVCHGVPAPKVWEAYIEHRIKKENNGLLPVRINMRSKVSGWSYYGYSIEFDYGQNKRTYIHNSDDLFMKSFISNLCLRESCSKCKFKGVNRCTDFTLGDYWGIWNQISNFDDNKGVSVVFVHSDKGKSILDVLSSDCNILEVKIEDAYKDNPSVVSSSKLHAGRDDFLRKIDSLSFEEQVEKFLSTNNIENINLMKKIIRKIGSLRTKERTKMHND